MWHSLRMNRVSRLAAAAAIPVLLTGCGAAITLPPIPVSTSSFTPSQSTTSEAGEYGLPQSVAALVRNSAVRSELRPSMEFAFHQEGRAVVVGNANEADLRKIAIAANDVVAPVADVTGRSTGNAILIFAARDSDSAEEWKPVGTFVNDGVPTTGASTEEDHGSQVASIVDVSMQFDDNSRLIDDDDYLHYMMARQVFLENTLPDAQGAASAPRWLLAGTADWVGQQVWSWVPDKMPTPTLPDDGTVNSDTSGDASFLSGMFVGYLADRYSSDRVLDFYRAVTAQPDDSIEATFRRDFGVDLAAAKTAWSAQAHTQWEAMRSDTGPTTEDPSPSSTPTIV